ncbi:HAL/PAL/TAL family ammonia-lyase [Proteiniphilum acetatigenes]|uniref:HAL/PAL/TAL family ammonia-lyase n=1 Tax=Proteiniphilum acetatigenes TaxID=294710 RepID=UPI00037FEE4D|nr:aromatic amino acid ammonia-lyase [Proteiniphilum acetatigenes]
MPLKIVEISEKSVDIDEIEQLLFGGAKVEVSSKLKDKVTKSFHFLQEFSIDKVIYGVNTGFGPMAQYHIKDEEINQLQYNIIRSHSVGVGSPIEPIYVKSAMIDRLCTFAQGYSGIHPALIQTLIDFINFDICPYVPSHGSVGASGDLVQLAHIALALIGEGEVFFNGTLQSTADVMKQTGIEPFKLHIREGLALTNGTSMMTGVGLVNLILARKLLHHALVASAMMNEIAQSYDDFLAPELNGVKQHNGQVETAAFMREWLKDSKLLRNRKKELYNGTKASHFKQKVQPYYSLRCVPQVLGPVWDTVKIARKVIIDELNSVSDNPIIDCSSENIYHGGNFHGDYISFEMDKLKIAVTKMIMLMERQLNYLMHDKVNEILPPFVNLGTLGLNYGMQAMQFTATSTTAENQTLSYPMYLHSIPNNNDNQDIVSMGTNSALLAKTVIENGFQVMAIHYMAIVQAVDCLQAAEKLSPKSQEIYHETRSFFPTFVDDKPRYKDINRIVEYLKTKSIVS